MTTFDEFWAEYPRHVGKLAAQRAYEKARKHATPDAILAGLLAFKRCLPREERFIPHASTWLNGGRWMDELPGVRQRQAEDWYSECARMHNNECGLSQWKHAQRVDIDRIKAEAS
jgi:hypothetical protein